MDGVDPYELVSSLLPETPQVAVTDAMPALHLVPLSRRFGGGVPVLATGVLRELRMIKDDAEIEALRRAGAAIDRVHARMGEWLRPGRTERGGCRRHHRSDSGGRPHGGGVRDRRIAARTAPIRITRSRTG